MLPALMFHNKSVQMLKEHKLNICMKNRMVVLNSQIWFDQQNSERGAVLTYSMLSCILCRCIVVNSSFTSLPLFYICIIDFTL